MIKYLKNYFLLLKYIFFFKKKDIVFYSDGIENDQHILDLLKRINKIDINVIYLFSSVNDRISQENFIKKNSFFIGKNLRIIFLNLLNANIVITTANDLNLFFIKKSPFVKKYIYTFHSLISTHMGYLEESFDYYDIILCSSNYQLREIENREKIYSIPKKEKLELGYANLINIENIKKNKIKQIFSNLNHTILIAPSWSKNGIDDVCISKILNLLISNNFNVIFRPHSSKYKMNKKFYHMLQYQYKKNFYLDLEFNSYNCFFQSSLMIADWGGVSLEYSVLNKPIIYIDTMPKIRNENYKKINFIPFEIKIRNEIGIVIKLEDIDKLPKNCLNLISNQFNKNKNIKKYIFDYNQNIDYVVSYIVDMAKK